MFRTVSAKFYCICILALIACGAFAQEAKPQASEPPVPYPRITKEAFEARLPFFNYDTSLPLEGRVVQQWNSDEAVREKIVFRGAQGFLVPGFIEVPKKAPKPAPLVLLLHGWSGSKQNWWEEKNIVSGSEMRKALLDAGYAVLALDAATHGERSNEIDYMHVNAFEDPKAPPKHNYFTYDEITTQTVKDYRRALDYAATRGDIDMNRIGLVGYSMGGMHSFVLLSAEPRLKMAVACVPPLANGSATSPIDYSWGIGDKPYLMLMGKKDELGDPGKVEASYHQYIEGPNNKLIWYDQGHKLTEIYVPDALDWMKKHL
jgi:dienelactone hydrolase